MKSLTQALVFLAVLTTPAVAGQVLPPPTVVPEPGTIALVVTGLGAIGIGAWWKRRR